MDLDPDDDLDFAKPRPPKPPRPLAPGEVRAARPLGYSVYMIVSPLAQMDPPPVLTGSACLNAMGARFHPDDEVDLVWRGDHDVEELTRTVVERLVRTSQPPPVEIVDRAEDFRELLVGDPRYPMPVFLAVDRRPPLEAPVLTRFERRSVWTDTVPQALADLLERLSWVPDLDDLERLDVYARCEIDLAPAFALLARRASAPGPLDLLWSLRDFDPADPDRPTTLSRIRLICRLQRALLGAVG